jgi:hypothetical protein
VSGSSYQLEYECIDPANERVFPHASCSCTATKLRLIGTTCGGDNACTLNSTKCASFVAGLPGCNCIPRNGIQPYCPSVNATPQCTATPKNGCILTNPSMATCGPIFSCGLNYSLVTVETHWAVACTFAVISDPKVAVMTAPMKVQCVGEYLEVGSVGHPDPPA